MSELPVAASHNEIIYGEAKKLRRITRACDYCHKRSIRCKYPGLTDSSRCQNCIDFDQPCRFDRVVKRRGAKPRAQTLTSPGETSVPSGKISSSKESYTSVSTTSPTTLDWKAPKITTEAMVVNLVEVYFEIVYPIFPFFHKPTFSNRIMQGEYLRNRFSFAATMALCALVSARIGDKALYNPRWNVVKFRQVESKIFYAAASKECVNIEPEQHVDVNLLRTCALLAITAIQYGNAREFQTYLGKYHMLVAMDRLHDEANWPEDIGCVELEERRRLFWSMYSLDIYSSAVWNDVIRCRERQFHVSLPSEFDDEFIDDSGYWENSSTSESPMDTTASSIHDFVDVRPTSWLGGWNFVIDMYRILEHVIINFRDRRRHQDSFLVEIFGDQCAVTVGSVTESIMTKYENLPFCFKESQAVSCDATQDRYSFQAASISLTIQLLKVLLVSSDEVQVEEHYEVTSEIVHTLTRIPIQYLRAMSTPLCHQLVCIGTTLVSADGDLLAESNYLQVRHVLIALAQLLDRLDLGEVCATSAEKLRNHVTNLDIRMDNQRRKDMGSFAAIKTNINAIGAGSVYDSRSNIAVMSDHNLSILNSGSQDLFDVWQRGFDYMQYPEG